MTIDVSEHTNALCELLQLDPPFVKEMTIRPTEITAVVYLKNEDSKKYLEQVDETLPGEHGEPVWIGFKSAPAVETKTFKVNT